MNCEPGDLAVVIRSPDERNIGLIVKVLEAHPYLFGWWYVDTAGRGYAANRNGAPVSGSRRVRVRDTDLRPIRDPGDDAVDEMLRPLPTEEPSHA